jgi:hypothetical protein
VSDPFIHQFPGQILCRIFRKNESPFEKAIEWLPRFSPQLLAFGRWINFWINESFGGVNPGKIPHSSRFLNGAEGKISKVPWEKNRWKADELADRFHPLDKAASGGSAGIQIAYY